MALTDRQQIARRGKLTASRIGVLMNGDEQGVYDLWLELTGDPSFTPKDFSDNWAVQLGNATEKLHLDWLEKTLGPIVGRGTSFQHPEVGWAMCTLDGWLEKESCVVEAKHNNGFGELGAIIDRYMPQLHWSMYCTDTEEICLSLIRGAKEPEPYFLKCNKPYLLELVGAAYEFMKCVFELRPPVALPSRKAPKPEFTRVIDMAGNNAWADAAVRWRETLVARQTHETAAKQIKDLVPDNAKEAFGHGIVAKRNKLGHIAIRTEKDNG